jgi:hypothetical protein
MSAEPKSDRSVGGSIKDLTSDLSQLVRSEITLAKAELHDSVARIGTGAGLFGGAGVVGLFAVEFLLLAAMFGIAAVTSLWLGALIVGVVLGLIGVVLMMTGKKKLQGATDGPARAIERIKSDAQVIKADVERAARRK